MRRSALALASGSGVANKHQTLLLFCSRRMRGGDDGNGNWENNFLRRGGKLGKGDWTDMGDRRNGFACRLKRLVLLIIIGDFLNGVKLPSFPQFPRSGG